MTMTDMTETTLEQFTSRTDELTKLYKANPQRFATEREAVTQAEEALKTAKKDAEATIARRKHHTRLIESAHEAGALSNSERGKIFERYANEYATPNIDDAQTALDGAWTAFWNALKKAEKN
jgi:hypothetical protein